MLVTVVSKTLTSDRQIMTYFGTTKQRCGQDTFTNTKTKTKTPNENRIIYMIGKYRKSGTVGLLHLLPVEYDSVVDVAHSVVIHLFGSTSMIDSTWIRKRLHRLVTDLWPQWWLLYERFTTLDIFFSRPRPRQTLGRKTKTKTKTQDKRLETGLETKTCLETSHWCNKTTHTHLYTVYSTTCIIGSCEHETFCCPVS